MSRRSAAQAATRSIADSVTVLPGAGPVTAARLEERGLRTVGDLLYFLPRGYDDLRTVTPLNAVAAMDAGRAVVVRGRVSRVRAFPGRFLIVTIEDGGVELNARWFRVPGGMAKQYQRGAEVVLAGPLRRTEQGAAELIHPSNVTARLEASSTSGLGIRSRYPVIEGIPGATLEKILATAVDRYAALLPDILPEGSRARLSLPSLEVAVRVLHRPSVDLPPGELDELMAGRSAAHRRIALDDLLVVQLGLRSRRQAMRGERARPCPKAQAQRATARLLEVLPFRLTGAQERAIAEIAGDMETPHPMQRLLVGDVGSGKTAVALAAACLANAAGGQTLLMAPTEVLAEQHARTLSAMAAPLGLRVGLLTASVKGPMRVSLLALLAAGSIHVLVGTHALLDESVALDEVALVVIDEQHRFGVAQRARLAARNGHGEVPHLLAMSATPIPRSLALAMYGDLDLSVLDQLPPGRELAAASVHCGTAGREDALTVLRGEIAAGRQGYVVCPVLSESTREGAVTAVARHAELQQALAPARVGLLHGQLDSRAKESVLRAFRDGTLDVLVATTVVEVGIDVPNATIMLVEEADRFGLAQLHQLRGRVGRGVHPGRCLLCTAAPEGEALQRLRLIEATRDGFRIAEADLQMRGHGELYGVRQAGVPQLRTSDLTGFPKLLELARAEADRIAAEDPSLERAEHSCLRAEIARRWERAAIYGEEAG